MIFILRKKIKSELQNYIEEEIIIQYEEFDKAHDLAHVENVIEFALKLSQEFNNVDQNIIYASAAYHDLGLGYKGKDLIDNREDHHQYSAKLVKEDRKLKKYFSKDEIELISIACYQHRSSLEEEVTKITSKIIADADLMDGLNIKRMIIRAWNYALENYQQMSISELYDDMYLHLINKYGKDGYAYQSLYLKESKELFEEEIKTAQRILAQKNKFKSVFKSLIKKKKIAI